MSIVCSEIIRKQVKYLSLMEEKKNEWATENIKEAPFWVDGMTPQEYDREREYYLRNFKKIKSGEIRYNKSRL